MAKIGTSLTGCLKSIVKGEVKISEVEFIITSTQYTSRQEMIDSIHRTMNGKYLGRYLDTAGYLWDTGRIFQSFGVNFGKRSPKTQWFDVPPVFNYR